MFSNSKFKYVSQAILDRWVSRNGAFETPKELYSGFPAELNVRMALNVMHTPEVESPLDWTFEAIKFYGFKSTIIDLKKIMPNGPLRAVPDQTYVATDVVPHYQSVRSSGHPAIDFVNTKVLGLALGYDRIVLPQKLDGRSHWCVAVTEGRFIGLARSGETAQGDPVDEAIIQLLMEGQTTKEVAAALAVSPRTVEHRIERIRVRYDARNVTHLVAKIMTEHLERRKTLPSDAAIEA